MRILVLAPQPFFTLRGTPIAVRLLLEALAAAGHEVDAITFSGGEDVEIEGVRMLRVPEIGPIRRVPPGFSAKKAGADVIMGAMAARLLRKHRYDVIHAVEEAAIVARWLKPVFGVPYVYDLDSSIPQQIAEKWTLPRPVQATLEAAERDALRRSVAALTCCPALEDIVRAEAPEVPVRTLTDISLLDGALVAQDALAASDVDFDAPVAMYVGNLEHYQGIDLLMEGMALAQPRKRMHLVVVGGGDDDIARYREKAKGLGIGETTHFLGPRPISALGAYLSAADIVVSPRLKGINTPMKVYSYLDSGRPLLATRLPTHTQVLTDDIVHLVEPTPEAMADGLVHLATDTAAAEAMAARAKARVRAEFNHVAFRQKLSAFYDEVVIPGLGRPRVRA